MLSKLNSRIRTNLSNLVLYIKYLFRRKITTNGKTVFVDVSDPRLERYLYGLLKMFDIAGWNVSIRFRPWLLLNLRNHSEWIYDIASLSICYRKPNEAALFLTDTRNILDSIWINTDYFSERRSEQSFSMPFSMHPSVYHQGKLESINKLRTKRKFVRVFIGGTLDHPDYENFGIGSQFGLVDRIAIRKIVERESKLLGNFVEVLTRDHALRILGEGSEIDFLLLRHNVLNIEEWLELMASSDFFLAPPGFMMPFSHNIIEAMAVGTVPITEYGNYFIPELTSGRECVTFKSEKEVIDAVIRAISSTGEERTELRNNTLSYYDLHLNPESVIENLNAVSKNVRELCIVAGHLSVENLQRRQSATGKHR